jgi:hypothetical protein
MTYAVREHGADHIDMRMRMHSCILLFRPESHADSQGTDTAVSTAATLPQKPSSYGSVASETPAGLQAARPEP